jgi:hypothetical protein
MYFFGDRQCDFNWYASQWIELNLMSLHSTVGATSLAFTVSSDGCRFEAARRPFQASLLARTILAIHTWAAKWSFASVVHHIMYYRNRHGVVPDSSICKRELE